MEEHLNNSTHRDPETALAPNSPAALAGEQHIVVEARNHIAFVTLNRPAALNSLTYGMVRTLAEVFERCAKDTSVNAVFLRGAGSKAFCAGGDVRAIFESFRGSGTLHRDFFVVEYQLDYSLHRFRKPYLVLMDGITMGGGMGLAQGSPFRLAGGRTRIAMPEVGIGLFPDVGASYFLSRLPGNIGVYLALTGCQIDAADAIFAGLADVYLAPGVIASLEEDLARLPWNGDHRDDLRRFLSARSSDDLPKSDLSLRRQAIDRHFGKPSVAAILDSLDAERDADSAWAAQTAAMIRSRSPTLLAVTFQQLKRGASLGLADCFRMELGMVAQCFEQGDFVEGIRAALIDKDRNPRWNPARLEDVEPSSIAAFFAERWQSSGHPLSQLESAVR